MLVLYFIFLANILFTSSFHGASFLILSAKFWHLGVSLIQSLNIYICLDHMLFAISIIVKQITLALAPSVESQNNQFFRPIVIGQNTFSLRLLLRLQHPSSRYVINESFRLRIYVTARSFIRILLIVFLAEINCQIFPSFLIS